MFPSRRSPPKRGEIVYEIKSVKKWFREQFVGTMRGIMRVSLSEIRETDPGLFGRELEHFESDAEEYFQQGDLDGLEMAYGTWVERELRIAIVNRLALVKVSPAWGKFNNRQRIDLAFEVILTTCLRCVEVRDAALKGQAIPPELPLIFQPDESDERYWFNTQKISPVETFGPELLDDDSP